MTTGTDAADNPHNGEVEKEVSPGRLLLQTLDKACIPGIPGWEVLLSDKLL